MLLSIGKTSVILGVSITTLRRWDDTGFFSPHSRTIGGHRRYSLVTIKEFLGDYVSNLKRKTIAYARVSSHDQKDDLKRQVSRLKEYCDNNTSNYEVIDDLGSGLNYKKRGLKKLIKLILSGQVSKLILTHKDRLLRFGSEIIFLICAYFGTQVEVIEEKKDRTDEESLAVDVLEIITVFSARLYGKRAHQNKKKKEILKNSEMKKK
jgi:predicted site-specific integrase-resolvase